MSEKLTDEQHASWVAAGKPNATDLWPLILALRAERAKTTQSDEEVGAAISCYGENRFCEPECYCAVHTKTCVSLLASIRAEGSAERAKLEAALIEARIFAVNWGDARYQGKAIALLTLINDAIGFPFAQPAGSGATATSLELDDHIIAALEGSMVRSLKERIAELEMSAGAKP